MNEFEQICFEMIASSGSAKTFYMSALKEAKDGRFAQAEHTMEAGDEALLEAQKAHSRLLSKEAGGARYEFSLLLMHAEDQMMTAETFRLSVSELLDLYARLQIRSSWSEMD